MQSSSVFHWNLVAPRPCADSSEKKAGIRFTESGNPIARSQLACDHGSGRVHLALTLRSRARDMYMDKMYNLLIPLAVILFCLPTTQAATKAAKANPDKIQISEERPVLWRNPMDIASRNLYYGSGGKAHEPHGTYTFEKEDMAGSNPKFDVIDQDGVKWRVKMGDEARPEVVASRLVWAGGYFANEDYFMPELHVQNMQRLHRGEGLVSPDGTMRNVRLKRHL